VFDPPIAPTRSSERTRDRHLDVEEHPRMTTSPRRTLGPRGTTVVAAAASYVNGAMIASIGSALVLFGPSFGIGTTSAGGLVSVFTATFAIGCIVGGRLGDALGRKRMYGHALSIAIVGLAGSVLAIDAPMLIAAVALAGLALGANVPVTTALIAESASPGRSSWAVGSTQTLILLAGAATQGLGALVSDLGTTGGRILFLQPFVVAVICRVLCPRILESNAWRRREEAAERVPVRVVLGRHRAALAATGLFFALVPIGSHTIASYGTYLLVEVAHLPSRTALVLVGAGLAVVICTSLLFQSLVGSRFRRQMIAGGSGLVVLGALAVLLFGASPWAIVVLVVVVPIGGSFIGEGLYRVWTQELFPPEARSTAQGLTYGVGRGVSAVAALVTPLIAKSSPDTLAAVMAGCALAGAVIGIVWIPRIGRRTIAAPGRS
jgi:MFS transporter, SP family, inositol transporter